MHSNLPVQRCAEVICYSKRKLHAHDGSQPIQPYASPTVALRV